MMEWFLYAKLELDLLFSKERFHSDESILDTNEITQFGKFVLNDV